MRKSLLAAGAALTLVAGTAQAATVQAAPVRAPAGVENAEDIAGVSVWLVAAFAAVALGLILLISDGSDSPTSP
ncbi:hypothetical protein [Altererythrobacter sp. Root672]|uniref:hypothetical protein n=1 Tax=Altererythrobacter sp. Root672 TaxID=1736584 RepID=UPI0012E3FA54|nr:hypothetical protein [Altererythrobacter sp. Root672]